MPHTRNRSCTDLLLKKLKFSPVVAIQGARQTGKSFLVRKILCDLLPHAKYQTFDDEGTSGFASSNPRTFLEHFGEKKQLLVLDEAQKVPKIFDAIKFQVDQERIPGKYLLLGSTEFSKLGQIRESLTGRMSRIRIYSLNLAEALEIPANRQSAPFFLNLTPRIKRKNFLTHLERGGLPGIFAVRSQTERSTFFQDWLELTCFRDALLFPKIKIEGSLCLNILRQVAVLQEPTAAQLAKVLRKDLRRIKTHLMVLETLFVLHRLDPHPLSTGKPLYYLCDPGLAKHLGAGFEILLKTWLIHEIISQRSYQDERQSELTFYRTQKGRFIDLVVESPNEVHALKLFPQERLYERDGELLLAFQKKIRSTGKKINCIGLGSSDFSFGSRGEIKVYAWESIG